MNQKYVSTNRAATDMLMHFTDESSEDDSSTDNKHKHIASLTNIKNSWTSQKTRH